MRCPNCKKEIVTVDMGSSTTKPDETPVGCPECGTQWDEASREPDRAWRLNDAGGGKYRIVEVVDGKLAAVGLQAEADSVQEVSNIFRQALEGMMSALEKPVVVIRQIIEEVG